MSSNAGSAAARKLTTPDLCELTSLFSSVAFRQAERRDLLQQFLQQTLGLTNGAGALFYSLQADNLQAELTLLAKQLQALGQPLTDEINRCALAGFKQKRVYSNQLQCDNSLFCVSCPLELSQGCLIVLLATDKQSLPTFMVTLQLLAALLDQYLAQKSLPESSDPTAVVPDSFLSQLAAVFNHTAGNERIVQFNQALKVLAGADLAVLALGKDGKKNTIAAVSDVVAVDRRTELMRLLQKGIDECVLRGEPLVWPGKEESTQAGVSLILEEIGRGFHGSQVVVLPLASKDEPVLTVLVLIWNKAADRGKALQSIWGLIPFFVGILPALQGKGEKRRLGADHLKSARQWSVQFKVTAAVALFFVLLLFLPLPYKLTADAVIKPQFTRFVVSRYDGLLRKSLVRPGDQVKAGQVLAQLDDRETNVTIASMRAELDKAKKMMDQATALGNTAAAQIARLDMQRYGQQLKRLEEQRAQLTLTSPVAGIVLTGDLQRAEGSPVSRGQTLFEVAPLGEMEVEVYINEQDISLVPDNTSVNVRFEAYPDKQWQQPFSRIEPRAKIINNKSVFVGIQELKNPERKLHPGMRGTAKIDAGYKLLGWVILRKPWYTFLRMLDFVL